MEVGLGILVSLIFFMAGFRYVKSRKSRNSHEIFLMDDGLTYRRAGSPEIQIKWSEVSEICYCWGPWYEDLFGVFPIRNWYFLTTTGTSYRIDDTDVNASVLMPVLAKQFVGFQGERETLRLLAQKEEFVDGTFHCWPTNA
jgi:hypothetical protein